MAYILNKSNGQQFTILNDGLIENSLASLSFVGKNVSNYGDEQNQNFLYLLENFANGSVTGGQPRSPITGQFWFDTSPGINRPLAFDGQSWRPIAVSWYDTTTTNSVVNALSNPRYPFAANNPGDFWVNSVTKQLYVITDNSSTTSLIGPEAVAGFDATRMISAAMLDKVGDSHPVIQLTVNGEVIAIFSAVAFETTTTNQVAGFPNVYRGVTFKNYSTSTRYSTLPTDVSLFGLHDQLDTSYPRRTVSEHIQNSWYIDNDSSLFFGTSGSSFLTWSSQTNSLNLSSSGSIKIVKGAAQLTFDGSSLVPTGTIGLGTVSAPYNSIFVTNITATNITASDIFQGGERVLTRSTLPAAGIIDVRGTTNQIAVTTNNGTSTISLPSTVNITNLSASNVSSTNVSASNITDSGARVITTATLPFSIGSVAGTSGQINTSLVGRDVTLSFPNSVTMDVLTANYISSNDIYQNGHRVLTTATLPAAGVVAVQGTANQVSANNVGGVVTVSLPSTVNINRTNITTATVTGLAATNATISGLVVTNATLTNITASGANVSGTINAGSIGANSLAVSGDAIIYSNLTATNLFASGDMYAYNVNGDFGSYTRQLNATYASVNTLTVLTNITLSGSVSATGNVSGNQASFASGTISNLTANTMVAQGETNFSNGTQKIRDVIEQVSILTSPSGTTNINLKGSAVVYYTSASTANWAFNFRGDGSTTTDSYLGTGQSVTVTVLVTQGTVAYYPTACSIDGVAVTPKWFGGAAPNSGDPSSVNAYTFTIVKKGAASFDLFASVTRYA